MEGAWRAVLLLSGTLVAVACAVEQGEEPSPGGEAGAKVPPPELSGVRLDMSEEEITLHLSSLGKLAGGDSGVRGAKQFWQIDEGPYAWLALRLDHDRAIEWLTAFVREDAEPVPYAAIGDTSQAVRQGQYFFTWSVPRDGLKDGYTVQARGNHPKNLTSVSLIRAYR